MRVLQPHPGGIAMAKDWQQERDDEIDSEPVLQAAPMKSKLHMRRGRSNVFTEPDYSEGARPDYGSHDYVRDVSHDI